LQRFAEPYTECPAITSIGFRDFFALFCLPLLHYRLLRATYNARSDTQKDKVPASSRERAALELSQSAAVCALTTFGAGFCIACQRS
jgi:hypothetical protein